MQGKVDSHSELHDVGDAHQVVVDHSAGVVKAKPSDFTRM